jgi:hypothetical protein
MVPVPFWTPAPSWIYLTPLAVDPGLCIPKTWEILRVPWAVCLFRDKSLSITHSLLVWVLWSTPFPTPGIVRALCTYTWYWMVLNLHSLVTTKIGLLWCLWAVYLWRLLPGFKIKLCQKTKIVGWASVTDFCNRSYFRKQGSGGLWFEASPRQIVHETLSGKYPTHTKKGTGGLA